MTFYLLVVTDDGEDSYSLWKTKASAESERRYIKDKFGISIYDMDISMDILEVDVYE